MKNQFSLARVRNKVGTVVSTLVIDDVHYDLTELPGDSEQSDIAELLKDWPASCDRLQAKLEVVRDADLVPLEPSATLAPVPRPGKIMCAAANYSAHVAEMAKSGFTGPASAPKNEPVAPQQPYHFLKATSCSVGPTDDIVLPSADHRIDWEVELAAVIGRPAKNVDAEHALDHVAGFVIVNDVSCRAATWREDRPNVRSDWLAGKSYDTFLPIGPYFLPSAFVPDYRELRLQLWVNGEIQQDGYAREMIFSLEDQIAYLSSMLTLESGDIIATGTPAGVGQGKGAYLKPGDVVEASISGMGKQRNLVRL